MHILISYQVAPESIEENEAAVRAFIEAVRASGDAEYSYTSFRVSDAGDFAHIGWFADGAAKDRFQALPEFKGFAAGLKSRALGEISATPIHQVATSS